MAHYLKTTMLTAVLLWLYCLPALANSPATYQFNNSQQSTRFHHLNETLRCPKCQNQNLEGSDAPIAIDLKNAVYQQIMAGQSDQQIIDNLKATYGDFITYKPPLTIQTVFLWFLPPLVLVLSLGVLLFRRR